MCEQEKTNDGEPVFFFEEVLPREKAGFSRRNDIGQKEEKKWCKNSASVAKFWIRSCSKVCCKVATFASSSDRKKSLNETETVIEWESRSIHLSSFFAHLEYIIRRCQSVVKEGHVGRSPFYPRCDSRACRKALERSTKIFWIFPLDLNSISGPEVAFPTRDASTFSRTNSALLEASTEQEICSGCVTSTPHQNSACRSLLSSVLSVILLLDSFGVRNILPGDPSPSLKAKGAASPRPIKHTKWRKRPGVKFHQTQMNNRASQRDSITDSVVCDRKGFVWGAVLNKLYGVKSTTKQKLCQQNKSSSTCVTERKAARIEHSLLERAKLQSQFSKDEECNNIYWNI